MIPRLHISFPLKQQLTFCFGDAYTPRQGEYMLNHARTGMVMALRAALPQGGRVGVVAYNCHTVANAVAEAGCTPVFVDVTEDMHIDMQHLKNVEMDAIVVTNLFGLRNDIAAVRTILSDKPIIVDNAHGYGIEPEGDFTVYSINQGKFPSLGEGGILCVNNDQYQAAVQQQYDALPAYTLVQEAKLFATMLIKAVMHWPWLYGLVTRRMKANRAAVVCREHITMRRMPKGVSRMYKQALPSIAVQIAQQKINAQHIADILLAKQLAERVWWGENAFMAIAQTSDLSTLSQYCAAHGVETATHFAKAISWDKQFGYTEGQCPMAERLTKEILMIPTYKYIVK